MKDEIGRRAFLVKVQLACVERRESRRVAADNEEDPGGNRGFLLPRVGEERGGWVARCRRGGLIALPWDGNERKRSRKKIADEDDEDFRELKFRSLPGIPVFRRIVAIKNAAKGADGAAGREGEGWEKKKEKRKAEDNAGG